jgi:outer membrane protein
MKKLILLLSLAFCLDAFSQIEKPITKGNVILVGGGSIQTNNVQTSFYSNSDPNIAATGVFTISLTPGLDYFIIDNLAIGLNTSISYYKQRSIKFYSLGAGPTIRYYFKNGLFVKAETSISYMHGIGAINISKQTSYSLVPGVGYAFFINQKVAFEPCLSYMYTIHHLYSHYNLNVNNVLLELKFSIFL